MEFPPLINWASSFPFLGLLDGLFHFYSNFKRNLYLQTVENLIRRSVLLRLIWFCTVCRCPREGRYDLYGLTFLALVVVCRLFSKLFFSKKCTIRVSNGLDPVLSVLIWVQTVCKYYQQTTKVAHRKGRVKLGRKLRSYHPIRHGYSLYMRKIARTAIE